MESKKKRGGFQLKSWFQEFRILAKDEINSVNPIKSGNNPTVNQFDCVSSKQKAKFNVKKK